MRVNGPFFATSVDRPYVGDLPSLAPAPGHPVIPCVRVKGRHELDTAAGQAAWGSVVPALWSFMLAARERGLGTAWTTRQLSCEREAAEVLGPPFDTVVQAALTPVADLIGTSFKPGPRADAAEFTHRDRW